VLNETRVSVTGKYCMLASKLMHVPSVRTMKVAVISNEAIENKINAFA
jgi:hypothetical protein